LSSPSDRRRMLLLAALAILGLMFQAVLEWTRGPVRQRNYDLKLEAATRASQAFEVIRRNRMEEEAILDLVNDPAGTGLIGPETSVITNAYGVLESKLTSLNPNFAAVIVEYFRRAGLKPGDAVAIAASGSFPGMNTCLYAALEAMDLRGIPITSVSASMWGATDPDFTWLDMESLLARAGVFRTRSVAGSPGGSNDMGRGLSPSGRQSVWETLKRNGVQPIQTASVEESITRRMEIYHEHAGNRNIRAYVNIGGGVASLGSGLNKPLIPTGLSMDLGLRNFPRKGTLILMAEEGVPVLHLYDIRKIAREYGLPVAPDRTPEVGTGDVFVKMAYRMDLAVVFLIVFPTTCLAILLPGARRRLGSMRNARGRG
jgi:poly-gamma-glutamate system protein